MEKKTRKSTMKEILEPHLNKAIAAIDQLDWTNKETYANWLAQNYYYVCHSTRLLAASASRFKVDRDKLHTQQANHIKEESHHERLAEADLKAMGYSISDFPELGGTKALYRSIYYLIEREHPIALYGYVYFLEWLPVTRGKEIMETAERCFGPNTARFLKVHVSDDPSHVESCAQMMADLPENERKLVEEAMITTSENYLYMMSQVAAAAATSGRKRKAA
jgi:thiaminase